MIKAGVIDMIMLLRKRGISDNRLLRVMELVPRPVFLGPEYHAAAYDDRSIPIACGQTLSSPQTVAMLTQVLDLKKDHKVLEIGTGTGYHAVVMSLMAKRIYSIERYNQLLDQAEDIFEKLEFTNIVTRHGDGRFGWKGQAPFDRIIITAGLNSPPKALLDQLKIGGKLVAVIKDRLVAFDASAKGMTETDLLPMKLPGIEAGKSKTL